MRTTSSKTTSSARLLPPEVAPRLAKDFSPASPPPVPACLQRRPPIYIRRDGIVVLVVIRASPEILRSRSHCICLPKNVRDHYQEEEKRHEKENHQVHFVHPATFTATRPARHDTCHDTLSSNVMMSRNFLLYEIFVHSMSSKLEN